MAEKQETPEGEWSYPTRIRLGAGRIAGLAGACREAGITRPLLVTDRGLAETDIVRRTLDLLEEAGLGRALFPGVDPDPTGTHVAAGVRACREGGHDGVIGLGGGSSMDLAKVVALMVGQTRPLWDFEDVRDWWTRADAAAILPVVAVPTTAGTGSELGRAGIITSTATREKKIIFHPAMLPSVVICDPVLTTGLSPALTAGTGLDAFAHCLEAYCSRHYHPMSQGIALEGMRLVKTWLPRAWKDGHDLEARTHMMSAAAMGAVAFQKGLGAIHALSHPLGAVHATHHGTTNAVLMPAVLRLNGSAVSGRLAAAAAYLGIRGGFEGFCALVQELNDRLGIPRTLTALGVRDPDIDSLVAAALRDPCAGGNPVRMTPANTREVLESCL